MSQNRAQDRASVRRALISVSDKAGLKELAEALSYHGVELVSTGGTALTLRQAGFDVRDASEVTGFPEMLDGRVKTLHPKIHGGVLYRRDDAAHRRAVKEAGVSPIDLVVVNLYRFEQTLSEGGDAETCIEAIDIGGPALLRGAAKNHADVAVVVDPSDYSELIETLNETDGGTTLDLRKRLAAKAFAHTAAYDAAIAAWFASEQGDKSPEKVSMVVRKSADLRYGENPHQEATLYATSIWRPGVTTAKRLQGKPLSYNNLIDADAAFELACELSLLEQNDQAACVLVKHGNPCGVAVRNTLQNAYDAALACDPTSAFGGVLAVNRPLNNSTARKVLDIFTEVVIAPMVTPGAANVLSEKPSIRVLDTDGLACPTCPGREIRSVAGGLLLQDRDNRFVSSSELRVVTDRSPSAQEMSDMIFAWIVAKHVKSNAIVFAKDCATVGIGAGQMSRVDSVRIASIKAQERAVATDAEQSATVGSVVASDAFFPFADGVLAAADAGATAIIQPGGSVRDEEVIAAANERGLAMAFTAVRHFRH